MEGKIIDFQPGYKKLQQKGILKERVVQLKLTLESCDLCPHLCGVDRLKSKTGFCRAAQDPIVASYSPHFGEEKPLVGRHGSGTIFFSHCNLRCVYCQNYDISCGQYGHKTTLKELSDMMLDLQERGCHNINLVTPTHFVPQIVESLSMAAEKGLNIPLVYNTGGYESIKTLRLLENIVDIYMPDIKYGDEKMAKKYSGINNYPEVVNRAVKEMHRQVGNLITDERGIALRGLIIRHLVLPGGISGTEEIMRFIAQEISPNTYVNIMAQYHPAHKAPFYPPLDKRVTLKDYQKAVKTALKFGIKPNPD